jgi:hypothetical protein
MAYAPPRKRRASPGAIADRRSRHRALELLAGCGPEGCSEAVMLANGIDVDTMVEIIHGRRAEGCWQRRRHEPKRILGRCIQKGRVTKQGMPS